MINKKILNSITNDTLNKNGIDIRGTDEYYRVIQNFESLIEDIVEQNKVDTSIIECLKLEIENILIEKSKDLELVVYLVILEIIIENIKGLVSGISIFNDFSVKYFNSCYPSSIKVKENILKKLDRKLSFSIYMFTHINNIKTITFQEFCSTNFDNKVKVESSIINSLKLVRTELLSIEFNLEKNNNSNSSNYLTKSKETISKIIKKYEKHSSNEDSESSTNRDEKTNCDSYSILKEEISYEKLIEKIIYYSKKLKSKNNSKLLGTLILYLVNLLDTDTENLSKILNSNSTFNNFVMMVLETPLS